MADDLGREPEAVVGGRGHTARLPPHLASGKPDLTGPVRPQRLIRPQVTPSCGGSQSLQRVWMAPCRRDKSRLLTWSTAVMYSAWRRSLTAAGLEEIRGLTPLRSHELEARCCERVESIPVRPVTSSSCCHLADRGLLPLVTWLRGTRAGQTPEALAAHHLSPSYGCDVHRPTAEQPGKPRRRTEPHTTPLPA